LGADIFAIATEVEHVCLDYLKPTQRVLELITAAELQHYYNEGQFPEGSMGPKVKAALLYLAGGGTRAVITDISHLYNAIENRAGTRIQAAVSEVVGQ
jgi:carbamate kinase